MQRFVVLLALVLTGCSTNFMKNAVVGVVDGQNRTTVMFVNPDGSFRPQFNSDCPPAKLGEERLISGGCIISASRVTDVEDFYDHQKHGEHQRLSKQTRPSLGTVGFNNEL